MRNFLDDPGRIANKSSGIIRFVVKVKWPNGRKHSYDYSAPKGFTNEQNDRMTRQAIRAFQGRGVTLQIVRSMRRGGSYTTGRVGA